MWQEVSAAHTNMKVTASGRKTESWPGLHARPSGSLNWIKLIPSGQFLSHVEAGCFLGWAGEGEWEKLLCFFLHVHSWELFFSTKFGGTPNSGVWLKPLQIPHFFWVDLGDWIPEFLRHIHFEAMDISLNVYGSKFKIPFFSLEYKLKFSNICDLIGTQIFWFWGEPWHWSLFG